MKSRMEWFRTVRKAAGYLPALLVICGWMVGEAKAEERKFAVMLAHSPKSFTASGQPGLPPGGLENVENVRKDYFEPNLDSFADYWDEISYGDVQITGQVLGWVALPWAFDPNPPNADPRPTPVDFINLNVGSFGCDPGAPGGYAYGAGEDFCDCFTSFDTGVAISGAKCGALIITDDVGNPPGPVPPPARGPGLDDVPVSGERVWTPGERFADVDGDSRWDSIDEKNDMACGSSGCRNICLVSNGRSGSERPCGNGGTCPIPGESCQNDPPGIGARGCDFPGCGELPMPCVDWNDDGLCENANEDCPLPVLRVCETDADCAGILLDQIPTPSECIFRTPAWTVGHCRPADCFVPTDEDLEGGNVELPPCCEGTENDPDDCIEGKDGVTCGTPIECCEYFEFDGDNNITVCEPFEDYMIKWDPAGAGASNVWKAVDTLYVRANYPGDVDALVARTGNGLYDSPDVFLDNGSTKMMQDAGSVRFVWSTPRPGVMRNRGVPAGSGFATEEEWFEQFWTDRYGSQPPTWPGGNNSVGPNSPRMRPFDPANPVPPGAAGTPGRRWFRANRCGWNGRGRGTAENPFVEFAVGGDNFAAPILPDEVFGYYDGWVEHDDLPSSKYHSEGDKRLGEITSPGTDTWDTLAAIFGADLGDHNPNSPSTGRDGINVAAGPYAVNIHGEKGFDAGDVCILEWLTWRTNGLNLTMGHQWALDNGNYHPYALDEGFKDYNLDGMIDQGEVRPERSESYSADSLSVTPNDGTGSAYPFNRRRMVEDIVEALDATTSWDSFIDPQSMEAAICAIGETDEFVVSDPAHAGEASFRKTVRAQGFVSGIVLVPPNAYGDINLFPTAPKFYPIHNEDNDDPTYMVPDWLADPFDPSEIHKSFNLHFHDLVICMDCRDPAPSVIPYAAHEYGHTWEGFPDLYDYAILDPQPVDDINCPIGAWDLMAGARGTGSLVHPNPVLKAGVCTAWVEPVDLTTILTPGLETTITLPRIDRVKNDSYFFLENDARPGERYYFWSTGLGFDARMPGTGMLIMKSEDIGANPEAVALQQRTSPYNFRMVQADGFGDLEACSSTGNRGDDGDPWPGRSGNTEFNFHSNPAATWSSLNRWTGLDISHIEPDGTGSVAVTLTWVPTNIPSLRFIDPPGGESVSSTYQIRFEATDLHGGTTVRLYYTKDAKSCNITGSPCETGLDCGGQEVCRHDTNLASPEVHFIGSLKKTTTGTGQHSFDWHLDTSNVPDGRYVLFAKLNPGVGADQQTEAKATAPRAGHTNLGNGSLVLNNVAINDDANDDDDKARVETWTAVCVNATDQTWRVNSNLTQPVLDVESPNDDYPLAKTGAAYTSAGGEVTFTIGAGSTDFALDDTFSFTTTGITTVSQALTVTDSRVSEGPIAVVRAVPLSGPPELSVDFDALDSSDPNGEPLTYTWDFGDNTQGAIGGRVTHIYRIPGSFTATLTATNPLSTRFDSSSVTINVFNNSPNAALTANPTIGIAPLTVVFSAAESNDGSETPADELVYEWDFGDGRGANDQGEAGLQFVQTTHVYRKQEDGTLCEPSNPCTFTATLTVTDTGEKTDTASIAIHVGNSEPNAVVSHSDIRGVAPFEVVFNASESTDPDPGDTEKLMVEWRWGDGSAAETLPLTGASGNTDGSVPHVFTSEGSFEVTASVFDENGGNDEWAGVTVVVSAPIEESSDPRASFTIDPSTAIVSLGDPVKVDAGDSFDRPTSDSTSEIASYQWTWGDGTANSSGETAEHTYAAAGTFRIRLTVRDLEGNTGTTSKTVTVLGEGEEPPESGDPPFASFTVDPDVGFENAVFTFDASASSDPDGGILNYRWDFGDGTVLPEGDNIETHRYVDAGEYVVRLTVRDDTNREAGATREITVLANVGNRAPVAIIGTGVRSGSAPLTITFDGRNSFDPDRDDDPTISFLWEFRRADNTLLNSEEGAIVTQTFDDEGVYSVELIVTDRRGGQDVAGPESIEVTAPFIPTDPGTGLPAPDDDDTPPPSPGGICGFGMMMGLFSSLLGLSLIRLGRNRRWRSR